VKLDHELVKKQFLFRSRCFRYITTGSQGPRTKGISTQLSRLPATAIPEPPRLALLGLALSCLIIIPYCFHWLATARARLQRSLIELTLTMRKIGEQRARRVGVVALPNDMFTIVRVQCQKINTIFYRACEHPETALSLPEYLS
jgi:hypothetical protein